MLCKCCVLDGRYKAILFKLNIIHYVTEYVAVEASVASALLPFPLEIAS